MPETYGMPEPEPEPMPEPTRFELVQDFARRHELGRRFELAVAGQNPLRTTILYVLTVALCISPFAPLAVVPVVLLMATDHDLAGDE